MIDLLGYNKSAWLAISNYARLKNNSRKGGISVTSEQYKALSVKEFDRAAEKYESGHAGVYEMCKKDYPAILEELEKEPFQTLLDCGCGTAPMLSLLTERYPERQYTGIDLSPKMIAKAREKQMKNVTLILGDCENLPFDKNSFDVIICSMSFHHYPDPKSFFDSVRRVLKPGGRLILRDITGPDMIVKLMNLVEMPLIHLFGYGDVRAYTRGEIRKLCENAGLTPEIIEWRKGFRLHCVARKLV